MRIFLFCVALLLGSAPVAVQAEVFERTLANGLKVIVKEDHRAPVVVQQIWYRAGSMDERTGVTGIAHVLEHLMFKGTHSVPAASFPSASRQRGGARMPSPATTTPPISSNCTNPGCRWQCSWSLTGCTT